MREFEQLSFAMQWPEETAVYYMALPRGITDLEIKRLLIEVRDLCYTMQEKKDGK